MRNRTYASVWRRLPRRSHLRSNNCKLGERPVANISGHPLLARPMLGRVFLDHRVLQAPTLRQRLENAFLLLSGEAARLLTWQSSFDNRIRCLTDHLIADR